MKVAQVEALPNYVFALRSSEKRGAGKSCKSAPGNQGTPVKTNFGGPVAVRFRAEIGKKSQKLDEGVPRASD